jgi:hypothetical protein
MGSLTESQAVGIQPVMTPRANTVLNLTGFTLWRLRAFVCPQPVLLSRLPCAPLRPPGSARGPVLWHDAVSF